KLDAAIDCYNQAVKIRPDFHRAWYNKARCYALQGKIEFAIESLEHAINLNPTQCVELAKNDPDFDRLRQHDVFKKLIGETHNLSSQRKSA
ncbi:MAG: TPR end-of-group domain-containing protein, partial [Microcoleaceae cyanobacterium]